MVFWLDMVCLSVMTKLNNNGSNFGLVFEPKLGEIWKLQINAIIVLAAACMCNYPCQWLNNLTKLYFPQTQNKHK